MTNREIKLKLSKIMLETNMGCMGTGIYSMQEVYEKVKKNYPELCNEQYLCIDNCKSGGKDPEYHHTIRGNMQTMKKRGRVIKSSKGSWEFLEIQG